MFLLRLAGFPGIRHAPGLRVRVGSNFYVQGLGFRAVSPFPFVWVPGALNNELCSKQGEPFLSQVVL